MRSLVLLLAGLVACRPSGEGSAVPPREKLSAGLRWMFDSAAGGAAARQRVLVDLAPQVDLARLSDSLQRSGVDRLTRRRSVVVALQLVAERSQTRLRPTLERLRRRGAIDGYEGFVVVNRLLVTSATPAGIRALAEERSVGAITEETSSPSPDLMGASAIQIGIAPRSWALNAIGVRVAWREGLDGRGVVVGIIDAGASAAHEQLRENYRGGDRSWHNPAASTSAPSDILRGHGTGVLSAAVGRSAGGRTIGVAPAAQWIACVGLPEGRYNNVALTECAEWMLITGQPDILINPWQLPAPGCDRSLQRIVDAWRAAEILPVFAAGNHGPGTRSDRSPANYAGALSVGAVTSQGTLFVRSSRGPNSCDASVYPTLVAPGAAVPVAYPLTESAYIRTDGTSVAAGLAAGVAALLLQRYPEAPVAELEGALRSGAADAGAPGPDTAFGYGRLSVGGALAALGRLRTKVSASNNRVAPAQR